MLAQNDVSAISNLESTVREALENVQQNVLENKNIQDIGYFTGHARRYERTLNRISELSPGKLKLLDVGSHYLHMACALELLGYEVHGIDVAAFSEQPLIRARASRYKVENYTVERLDFGDFWKGSEATFDVIVFSEILEHITFNPVAFWRRIYEVMKEGALIYLTTPNSMTPWKMASTFKNLVTMQRTGIPPSSIFSTVTYGHHWKEYSGPEVREYFLMLSPDFTVEASYYNLDAEEKAKVQSIKSAMRQMVHWGASFVPPFRDHLEAVVRLNSKTCWSLQSPEFL